MDWKAVIERQGAALRRVVEALVCMVGPGTGAELRAPGAAAADRPTLARHRHRALLRVLRPAEAAARRLVIVVALAVLGPQPSAAEAGLPAAGAAQAAQARTRRPHRPSTSAIVRDGAGTGIVIVPLPYAHPTFGLAVTRAVDGHAAPPAPAACAAEAARPRALRLPLADPVRRMAVRRVRPRRLPRISTESVRPPERRPPQRDDRLDATRLVLRIDALAAALGDLPGEARRFLRWRRRRAAMLAREAEADQRRCTGAASEADVVAATHRLIQRHRRAAPLRAGRPPGWRRRPRHEVEAILADLDAFARELLRRPDTS